MSEMRRYAIDGEIARLAFDPDEDAITLRDILEFLRSSARIILAIACVFALAASAFIVTSTKRYTATTQVLYEPNNTPSVGQDGAWQDPVIDNNQTRIDSQVELIASSDIAVRVIEKLDLAEMPEYQPREGLLLKFLSALDMNGLLAIDDTSAQSDLSKDDPLRYARLVFQKNLTVVRVGEASALSISYDSDTPKLAAQVANAVAEAYIKSELEAKAEARRRGGEWLLERLDDLRRQAFEAKKQVETFKTSYSAGSLTDSQVKLSELESQEKTYRTMYENFLQRYTETLQKVSYPVEDARIISKAYVPSMPSHPRKLLILAFSTAMGILTGTAICLARASLDRKLRTPKQLRSCAAVPCIGTLDYVTQPNCLTVKSTQIRNHKKNRSQSLIWRSSGRHRDISILDAVRPIRDTLLTATAPETNLQSIGFINCGNSEGASTIANGFAYLQARSGSEMLLIKTATPKSIDRRDRAMEHSSGLHDALRNETVLRKAILQGEEERLKILPVGRVDTDITLGDRMSALKNEPWLALVKKQFEMIVVDLPSMNISNDSRLLAPLLDGVVVVAEPAVTNVESIRSVVRTLRNSKANVLGVVVNKVTSREKMQWMV